MCSQLPETQFKMVLLYEILFAKDVTLHSAPAPTFLISVQEALTFSVVFITKKDDKGF